MVMVMVMVIVIVMVVVMAIVTKRVFELVLLMIPNEIISKVPRISHFIQKNLI